MHENPFVGFASQQSAPANQNTSTSAEVVYHNRTTGHIHRVNKAGVCWGCLLAGAFFWPIVGEWGHFVAAFALSFLTFVISMLIYPFFANKIIKHKWESRGYTQE